MKTILVVVAMPAWLGVLALTGRVFISAGGAAMFIFNRSLAGPLAAVVLLALLVVLDALFVVGVP